VALAAIEKKTAELKKLDLKYQQLGLDTDTIKADIINAE
jgi:hypothetical protein